MGKYLKITFSPVTEFIEKTRKLRDLYGSSFLLSYLSFFTAKAMLARDPQIQALGLREVVRGTPDEIIFVGKDFTEEDGEVAKEAFDLIWSRLVTICQQWLREKLPHYQYSWNRYWNSWKNHAWEFFYGLGDTREAANQDLLDRQYQRRVWVGINWEGDSSSLSGGDAIAFPNMSQANPHESDYQTIKKEIDDFYKELSIKIGEIYLKSRTELDRRYQGDDRQAKIAEYGEAIISPNEPLNIPELVKRLVMIDAVGDLVNNDQVQPFPLAKVYLNQALEQTKIDKLKKSYYKIERFGETNWSGWFSGDGDGLGKYTRSLSAQELNQFTQNFQNWNDDELRKEIEEKQDIGRLIYAGGDDFLGIFIPRQNERPITGKSCWAWWRDFAQIWSRHGYSDRITVSVGFVWAAPKVPQRRVLQHCNEVNGKAKSIGKNRIVIRILFNSDNHLEWSCPWWFLKYLGQYQGSNWDQILKDVAHLEAQHAFNSSNTEVGRGILRIYFGESILTTLDHLWNHKQQAGILGDRLPYLNPQTQELDQERVNQALNNWIVNLAKVGYYLFRDD
ncbi:MAG: type III-B CRISPR-associated protein Cas10/Cmr2 [Cyanobacteria bacterium P01_A01_bin.40]